MNELSAVLSGIQTFDWLYSIVKLLINILIGDGDGDGRLGSFGVRAEFGPQPLASCRLSVVTLVGGAIFGIVVVTVLILVAFTVLVVCS